MLYFQQIMYMSFSEEYTYEVLFFDDNGYNHWC